MGARLSTPIILAPPTPKRFDEAGRELDANGLRLDVPTRSA